MMNMQYTKKVMVIVVLLLTMLSAGAQTVADSTSSDRRPRVGVVLSGGGAKGMAHIGVLKVLERAGIPVDIVTGTSMGSIVGGLYATGYSAAQLDSIVRAQDWTSLLADRMELRQQSLASRKKQNTYLLTKRFAMGKKDMSDMGLLRGRNISRLFEQLVGRDSIDFNTLTIPFACVATDIVDNTEYDFHSGRLAQAMRASMAIPAAFSPVRLDDHVLVDGGLRNNYPADLAREMGADIIIGVSVQGEGKTAGDLGSTGSIIGQIVDVNCKNKYDDNWAMTDVRIRVDVKGYSTVSFTPAAIDTLIRRGEEEAMRHWEEILAVKQQAGAPLVPQPHKPMMPEVASEPEPDKPSEASVSVGVRLDSEERVAMQGNLNVPFNTRTPTDLDLTLRLGKRIMARAELAAHRHKGASQMTSKLMSRAAYLFRHDEINIYNEGDKSFNFTYNQHVGELTLLDFGIRNFNFDLGARFDYYDFRDLLIDHQANYTGIDIGDDHYISYHARVAYTSEDSWQFPTRGAAFRAQYAYYTDNFADLNDRPGLSDVSASWRINMPLSSRFILQPMAYGRLLFGAERPVYLSNAIGGEWFAHYTDQQMPFAGIGHLEHTDPHFLAVQMQGQQRIGSNHYVTLRLAAAQHAQRLSEITDHHTMLGLQMAYAYNTPFGPLGASLGYSNHTEKLNFFVNLGFEF